MLKGFPPVSLSVKYYFTERETGTPNTVAKRLMFSTVRIRSFGGPTVRIQADPLRSPINLFEPDLC